MHLMPIFLCSESTFDFRLVAMTARTRIPAGGRTGGGTYDLQKLLEEKIFSG